MLDRIAALIRGLERSGDGYSRALQAARVRASYQRAYFAPALFSLIPVKTDQIGSMAVDSHWRLYYNDAWVAAHTVEENAAVLIHEVSHLLREHGPRKQAASVRNETLWNTATEFNFDAVYKDGLVMNISDKNTMGVTFEGDKGKIYVTRGKIESTPEGILESKIGANEIHLYNSKNHFGNFVDCVLSRKETIAPVEIAHRSITICHLGNIAMRLGKSGLKWDPDQEKIIGDSEASAMLSRPYRAPWKLEV